MSEIHVALLTAEQIHATKDVLRNDEGAGLRRHVEQSARWSSIEPSTYCP